MTMTNSTRIIGNGPHKVMALHGWFGSAHGWGPLYDVLNPHDFTYAFMDYRGYGGSMAIAGDFTIAEIAGDAVVIANDLNWERFSLIGHSMGGKAIQQVLLDVPDRVRKLVAITPVPACEVPFDEQGWAFFSGAAKDPAVRKGIIDLSTGKRLSEYWLDKMVAHSLNNSTVEAFAAYLNAWAKTDFSDRVKGNSAAIKVIVGEHDPTLTAESMRQTYMQWYPNAQLEIMANAGHYPADETPVCLATTIEAFLRA
ncbi:MAG: hydrolase, alpha/beta fold family protein [Herminiimonas sp.]|nr:hydrolase, alpha/beta fold family protein [Herminiimonas sp.]